MLKFLIHLFTHWQGKSWDCNAICNNYWLLIDNYSTLFFFNDGFFHCFLKITTHFAQYSLLTLYAHWHYVVCSKQFCICFFARFIYKKKYFSFHFRHNVFFFIYDLLENSTAKTQKIKTKITWNPHITQTQFGE